MTDFHKLVPLPAPTDINTGFSPCHQATMLQIFGRPGRLTQDCSPIQNGKLLTQIKTHQFNNFSVTGWGPAVDSLVQVMTDIYGQDKELHSVIRTAGMLCCRAVRGSLSNFSNHSWGTAIDLKIQSELDELGADHVQAGILAAYPHFHRHGWYWAAGYPGRKDPMHMELADETVRRLAAMSGWTV